jgi:hypothetical protein
MFFAFAASTARAQGVAPRTFAAEIEGEHLQLDRAVAVHGQSLQLRLGTIELQSGFVVPATPIGGSAMELVFIGDGRIAFDPHDPIESHQLQLFTGAGAIDETFHRAVFVVGSDVPLHGILASPPLALAVEPRRDAEALFASWKSGTERRILATTSNLFAAAGHDPSKRDYVAASLRQTDLGSLLYEYDPENDEPLTIGQFVPLAATSRERQRLERNLQRQQGRGHLIGVTTDDLGDFDTWCSAPAPAGTARSPWFTTKKYVMDVSLDAAALTLRNHMRVTLEAHGGNQPVARFTLPSDLIISRVADAAGSELPFHRAGSQLDVVLSAAPADGQTTELAIEYAGAFLEKGSARNVSSVETLGWYPRIAIEPAMYDVTYHWPESLMFYASGHLAASGAEATGKWARYVTELPTRAIGFESGRFSVVTFDVDGMAVTLGLDPHSAGLNPMYRQEIRSAIESSLRYFTQIYGKLPLREMTVLTVPRDFSQGLLGFVTLSDDMMEDFGEYGASLGVEDRRSVIAHEIAHQWFGHLVGWTNYRAQWISEALATYSSLQFTRSTIASGTYVGGTARWQQALSATTRSGLDVEEIGPVTLGVRLDSSLAKAYEPIVYRKGALTFDTLAFILGQRTLNAGLKSIVDNSQGGVISTEDLLASLSRTSKTDLTAFARRFVYGSALPLIEYRYAMTKRQDGKWLLRGEANERMHAKTHYAIVRSGAGYDVRLQWIADAHGEDSWQIGTPFRIDVVPPSGTRALLYGEHASVMGGTPIHSGANQFDVDVAAQPTELTLDPEGRTLAWYEDVTKQAKRTRLRDADNALAADHGPEAEQLLLAALAQQGGGESAKERTMLDAYAHLRLARMRLDAGRLDDAARELDSIGRGGDLESAVVPARARLSLLRGDAAAAYDAMRKATAEEGTGEEYALLAIAAKAMNHPDEAAIARIAAKRHSVDVSAFH